MEWELSQGVTKALNRMNIYALLASIFQRLPDQTFTQNVLSLNLKREVHRFYGDNRDISLGVNLIRNHISLNKMLPLDHAQKRSAIKPPYESIYTNRPSQEIRGDILSDYETAGVINQDILNDPDYIGSELNFMAELCAKEVLRLSQGYSSDTIFEGAAIQLLQKEFLQNHIGNWVPSYANELIHHATTDFFKGAGFLLKGYIGEECSRFAGKGE